MELLVALLLAQTTATLAASREYYFVNQQATWHQAQTYCRERFTDLATIETEEDMARVTELVLNSGFMCAWTGLYDDVDSWRWSLDNTSLYAGANTAFGNWLPFYPNNKNSNQHCIVISSNELHDNNCEDSRNSVCYDEPTDTYIALPQLMTWKAAQSYCRETYTDLASIRDEEELESIVNVIEPFKKYWIGLSRESWKWSDHSEFLFRPWAETEPNSGAHNCACTGQEGFRDTLCQNQRGFICSAPVKKMVKMVLKSNGNLDLNDPIIQEAILIQVEMDMKGAGIQQKIRVTWRKQPTGKVFTLTTET